MELKEILLGQTPYAYVDEGIGPVLLLIHGSLCDYRYWKWQVPELAKHFRVIAPSLRHYAPIPLDSTEGFSFTQHAQDMVDLLDYLNISQAHVLGHSRGAAVALEMALHHRPSVASLILADPGVRNPEQLHDSVEFKKEALRLIQEGQLDAGLSLFIDTVSGPGTFKRMVRWFKEMVRDNANTLFLQRFEPPFLINNNLHSLDSELSITLIGGSDSPAPFPDINRSLQGLWPHAKSFVIAPASHGMNLAMPHEFNHVVSEHILRLTA